MERLGAEVEVEPSIYAADFSRLGEQLDVLVEAGARVFHFDVGDGHFIPEITIGPIVLASISPLVHAWGAVLDCHLMVEDPERHFDAVAEAGGDSVTFHVEACADPARAIAAARSLGLGVGVAFNPETPVEEAAAAAEGADLVLCMSIHPGYSGQSFMPEATARIARLRDLLSDGRPRAGRRRHQRRDRRRRARRGCRPPRRRQRDLLARRSRGGVPNALGVGSRARSWLSRSSRPPPGVGSSGTEARWRACIFAMLFDGDPARGERLTAEAAGLYLDYSKHRVTDDTLQLLRRLAAERGLEEKVRAMFRGEPVNISEGRPALHVALRMPRSRSLVVDGVDVVKEVHAELDRMSAFAELVRSGEWVGATGRPIRAVVNIGIGGSDLGPAMAYEALAPSRPRS